MIAGLEDITSGEISIDGRIVNELIPDRDIAMVFRTTPYPHTTVFENMAFSLRYRGIDRGEIRCRVDGRRASSTSRPSTHACRASCRAASASASPWAAPSCAIPGCSCSTSRSQPDAKLRVCAPKSASRERGHDHDLRHARPGRGHDAGRLIVILNHGRSSRSARLRRP
jgi:hypothetical protein